MSSPDPLYWQTMSSLSLPRVLIGSYFPRSLNLEGAGNLVRGLAEAMIREGWRVRVVVPAGTSWNVAGAEASFFHPGLLGMLDYHRAIRHQSHDADAILIVANNPAMVQRTSASAKPERTFYMFLSPLNSLNVIREIGLCQQALVHAAAKSILLARFFNWSQKRCIIASDYQAKQLRDLGAGEIHLLPVVGISKATLIPDRDEARRRLGWPSGPIAGYLGHFSPAKGVEAIVEAFKYVPPEYRLALAHSGKGQLSGRGNFKLEKLRQTGRLLDHGVVDALAFLAACDVIVLPYVTSSIFHLPQVMLESFASSTPVVTTRVGGVAEIVEKENLGLVVPPRSPTALAEAINKLLADQETALRMGRNARRIFQERLCAEVFVANFQKLMFSPGPVSRQKRDAWAVQAGTETYVKKMGSYALARDAEIIRNLIGHGPGRLLDFPCGTGRNFDLARHQDFEIVGADYSPTMLSVARKHQGVPLVRADAFTPPFAPESFDVIMVPRLLFHYADPQSIIGALLPALKPNGRMVFDTLNKFSTRWLASLLLKPFRDPARQTYFESPSVFIQKLTTLGLEVTQHRSTYVLPTRVYRFLPGPLVRLVHAAESLIPKRLRVLTFWQVQRSQTSLKASTSLKKF